MARLGEIVDALNELLEPEKFSDYCPNGLQVPPVLHVDADINRIALAVSPDLEVIKRAAAADCQLLLLHHGLFWNGPARSLDGSQAARLRELFKHDMALVSYHLPLDGHETLGNNAIIANRLGCEFELWQSSGRPAIGVRAKLAQALQFSDLCSRVGEVCQSTPIGFAGSNKPIQTVAIVSGGAASMIVQAADDKIDCLITGEPKESSRALAAELDVSIICAGHHRTETFGVAALGDWLADRFDVSCKFFDTENPI